jgi:hypothetical protein
LTPDVEPAVRVAAAQEAPDRPEIPAWAHQLVRYTDEAVRIPGTSIRVGLDAVLGALVPGAGDAVNAGIALALVVAAVRMGAPRALVVRMLLNIAIDLAAGAVPVVGDVFDVAFKANRRNMDLLRAHAGERRKTRAGDVALLVLFGALFVGLIVLTVWGLWRLFG